MPNTFTLPPNTPGVSTMPDHAISDSIKRHVLEAQKTIPDGKHTALIGIVDNDGTNFALVVKGEGEKWGEVAVSAWFGKKWGEPKKDKGVAVMWSM